MEILLKAALCVFAAGCLFLTILGLGGNTALLLLLVGYAALGGFTVVTLNQLALVAVFYVLGELWDFLISFLGIKKEKVSWATLILIGIASVLGSLLGTLILPIAGSLLGAAGGAFAAAFGAEYFSGANQERAFKVALAAAKNHLWGIIGKLAAGVVMLVIVLRALF